MMSKRQVYEDQFNAQLKVWSAEIALMKAKAIKAKAGAKIEYYRSIGTLQSKHDSASTNFQALRASGDDAWDDLKIGAENIWIDAKSAFGKAASQFK